MINGTKTGVAGERENDEWSVRSHMDELCNIFHHLP